MSLLSRVFGYAKAVIGIKAEEAAAKDNPIAVIHKPSVNTDTSSSTRQSASVNRYTPTARPSSLIHSAPSVATPVSMSPAPVSTPAAAPATTTHIHAPTHTSTRHRESVGTESVASRTIYNNTNIVMVDDGPDLLDDIVAIATDVAIIESMNQPGYVDPSYVDPNIGYVDPGYVDPNMYQQPPQQPDPMPVYQQPDPAPAYDPPAPVYQAPDPPSYTPSSDSYSGGSSYSSGGGYDSGSSGGYDSGSGGGGGDY